jgi:4-amino-4-deoxy-L-arabinose transferase-like glycosyltransferase
VAACYTFWNWLKKPTWWNTLASGVVLGVAELTKTTLIIFYPLWPLLWLIYRWPERKRLTKHDWLGEFGKLCVRVVIALYVINLGYGFEGSFTKLKDYNFVCDSLSGLDEIAAKAGGNRFANSLLAALPIPLPKNYLLGIDLQRRDFEHYHGQFYLGGVWSKTGWWYYYLYAIAIKVPLGTWLLLVFAAVASFFGKEAVQRRDEFYLLFPGVTLLAFVSSQTGINEHMRYVLPIFPFFYIWVGQVTPSILAAGIAMSRTTFAPRHFGGIVVVACLIWSVGSSLFYFPHTLSYFNEVVGGPTNGWKHLANSNVDWGQDLILLQKWIDENNRDGMQIHLCYFGPTNPMDLGLNLLRKNVGKKSGEIFRVDAEEQKAIYAISSNVLCHNPLAVYNEDGELIDWRELKLNQLDAIEPTDFIGYSIFIFQTEVRDSN